MSAQDKICSDINMTFSGSDQSQIMLKLHRSITKENLTVVLCSAHTDTHMYTNRQTHTCMYRNRQTDIHIYTHINVHTNTDTYRQQIYTHIQTDANLSPVIPKVLYKNIFLSVIVFQHFSKEGGYLQQLIIINTL